jgi:outer membrane biosynthesis protein TonB
MSGEYGRLAFALLLSLLTHMLLLSLTFGGQGLGLPGFGFPWGDRRIEAPPLSVVLVPMRVPARGPAITSVAEPLQQPSIEQRVASGPAPTPSMPSPAPLEERAVAIPPAARVAPEAEPKRNTVTPAPRMKAPARADVPAAPVPTPFIAVAPGTSSPETVTSPIQDAGNVAREAARLEAQRQEAARLAAAQQEAQRQEAARQEAARVEAARLEAERQEAARLAAAQEEAQRQEAARQEAARVEGARLEAERQEAARLAAAQQEAARVRAEQEAQREARLRAIGRQLDEEAARREELATAPRLRSTLPLSLSTARRVRLWGRTDPNVELIRYAEAWERKIQLNTPVDTVRELAKRPHTNPMVTVAIRSDGSVESVTFVLSSGVPEVDEAIRRIVQSHEHYQVFPPELARDYDVVEIRRTWSFDVAVRFY